MVSIVISAKDFRKAIEGAFQACPMNFGVATVAVILSRALCSCDEISLFLVASSFPLTEMLPSSLGIAITRLWLGFPPTMIRE